MYEWQSVALIVRFQQPKFIRTYIDEESPVMTSFLHVQWLFSCTTLRGFIFSLRNMSIMGINLRIIGRN